MSQHVDLARNWTLMLEYSNTASIISSQAYPGSGINAALVSLTCHAIGNSGAGTPSLAYQVQASNDLEEWKDVSGETGAVTTATTIQGDATAHGAYFRLQFHLTVSTGSPGDIVYAIFSANANFYNA